MPLTLLLASHLYPRLPCSPTHLERAPQRCRVWGVGCRPVFTRGGLMTSVLDGGIFECPASRTSAAAAV